MTVHCPHCDNTIETAAETGQEVVCPSCGSSIPCESDSTGLWVPSATAAAMPQRLGKFEVLEQIGAGASGTVYKARDSELGRIVALKVPRTGILSNKTVLKQFLREARSAAQL